MSVIAQVRGINQWRRRLNYLRFVQLPKVSVNVDILAILTDIVGYGWRSG